MNEIHLVCNAHLDPVWLWPWQEGAAEALSTFRVAADFCDEFEGYIFNHNEALLYEWVEEYDPRLFTRIRNLVEAGRWHIMGGWYLQPDCNMPSGESLVRQVLYGRRYFQDKFGKRPTTAINFDPFGHSRGLVQILSKSGYDSYIFCRPMHDDLVLPAEEFDWIGFDGSKVIGHRGFGHYLSQKGEATSKIKKFLDEGPSQEGGLLLWGIGNHGGGASRQDLEAIAELSQRLAEDGVKVIHSTPEDYFKARSAQSPERPAYTGALNPWAPGCYTSQIRIKQTHRELENELYSCEKMATQAALRGLMEYPQTEVREALKDLMFCEFHDILPGTSIAQVEEYSLARLCHGLEIVSRVKARAFFALSAGEPLTEDGVIPLFLYNPHPFTVEGCIDVEFQPSHQNWTGTFMSYEVCQVAPDKTANTTVPAQFEKEASSVGVDWRKRLVMRAKLPASSLSRFECTPVELPEKPNTGSSPDREGRVNFKAPQYEVTVGPDGLLESWVVEGSEVLAKPGPVPMVLNDSDDPWESKGRGFDRVKGVFRIAEQSEAAEICGTEGLLAPVRVIEDGPVRTIVEAILVYDHSHMVLTYELPKAGSEIGVHARILWQERRAMLKLGITLSVPEGFGDESIRFVGQTAYGVQELVTNGEEAVSQRWVAVCRPRSGRAVTVINGGTYGSSLDGTELRLTLLRSSAYSALPTTEREAPVPKDRYIPRFDQGERSFRFWLNAGPTAARLAAVDREATVHGERPTVLMYYPSADIDGNRSGSPARRPALTLSDDVVQLAALKLSEDGKGYILRLFNPTGEPRRAVVTIPVLGIEQRIDLSGYEIVSLLARPADLTVSGDSATLVSVNLLEEC